MTDRQSEEGWKAPWRREAASEQCRERKSQFVHSHVFLRLIIRQIRRCFLLIRSAVTPASFNRDSQTDTCAAIH